MSGVRNEANEPFWRFARARCHVSRALEKNVFKC